MTTTRKRQAVLDSWEARTRNSAAFNRLVREKAGVINVASYRVAEGVFFDRTVLLRILQRKLNYADILTLVPATRETDVLATWARHASVRVRRAVAANPFIDEDTQLVLLARAIKDWDDETWWCVLRHTTLSPTRIDQLSNARAGHRLSLTPSEWTKLVVRRDDKASFLRAYVSEIPRSDRLSELALRCATGGVPDLSLSNVLFLVSAAGAEALEEVVLHVLQKYHSAVNVEWLCLALGSVRNSDTYAAFCELTREASAGTPKKMKRTLLKRLSQLCVRTPTNHQETEVRRRAFSVASSLLKMPYDEDVADVLVGALLTWLYRGGHGASLAQGGPFSARSEVEDYITKHRLLIDEALVTRALPYFNFYAGGVLDWLEGKLTSAKPTPETFRHVVLTAMKRSQESLLQLGSASFWHSLSLKENDAYMDVMLDLLGPEVFQGSKHYGNQYVLQRVAARLDDAVGDDPMVADCLYSLLDSWEGGLESLLATAQELAK